MSEPSTESDTSARCGTCRHWTPPIERDDFHNIYRGDETDRLFGVCRLIDLADSYEDAPDPVPLAVTKDGSDYKATLYTQPEFGCVLHEISSPDDASRGA